MIILLGILEEGLVYAIMALGVYITYKILDFPDLSVDGTFPMGAALTATLIVAGVNPYLTLVLSFLLGAAAGCVTGLIHVKLKVRDLLSGIIVMTGLYSINMRLAGGRANLPIFSQETVELQLLWRSLHMEWERKTTFRSSTLPLRIRLQQSWPTQMELQ